MRESRLNTSRDFRREWDVPSLNRAASDVLVDEVRKVRGRAEPDPAYRIPVLLAAPGYGKTHLFGRVGHALGDEVLFVFLPPIEDPARPDYHVRWHAVEALFRAPAGRPSPLAAAMGRLCHPSFVEYVGRFPPSLAARHQGLRKRLADEGPALAIEMARGVTALTPFLHLADSTADAMPHLAADVVRALVLGWSPAAGHLARRWLRGEGLTEADLKRLRLPDQPPQPLAVLTAVALVLGPGTPMVVCFDQIESVLKHPDGARRLTAHLMELVTTVPNQAAVLSCLEAEWPVVLDAAFASFPARVRSPLRLRQLNDDEAVELLARRLDGWAGRDGKATAATATAAAATAGRAWPFDEEAVRRFVRDEQPNPRALIDRAAAAFDSWLEGGRRGPIRLRALGPGQADPAELFVQEWGRELEAIRRDPQRTPAALQERRLYRAVHQALLLAQGAGRDVGGVRIVGVQEGAVPQGGMYERYALRVDLSAAGGPPFGVAVPVTKLDNGQAFRHYFEAVRGAATSLAGVLLVHAQHDLPAGQGTRDAMDDMARQGRLRVFALRDEPAAFEGLECLLGFLDKADAQDLRLGGRPVGGRECREFVLDAGVLDDSDLFKALAAFAPAASPAAGPVDGGAGHFAPAANGESPAAGLVGDEPAGDRPPPDPAADIHAWAADRLRVLAEKLALWGQPVEPLGVEVGPTFVRLGVRPAGVRTSYRKIADRAADLKAALGLDVAPLVGSHAGHVSVDVPRPGPAAVSLADLLTEPPAILAGRPAFPVGVDVGGRARWLDLSDPTDCHLLVAGAAGAGKSNFLRSLVASLAGRLGPKQVQFVLVDPGGSTFDFIGRPSPYLPHPPARAAQDILAMIERCRTHAAARLERLEREQAAHAGAALPVAQRTIVPRVVVVVDEFAGLVADSTVRTPLADLVRQVGSMSRAAGIHLVLATGRPDGGVVTPAVRDALPGRVAFRLAAAGDSERVLGAGQAASLLGRGDLLWRRGGGLLRLQCPWVTQAELETALRLKDAE